MFRCLLVGLGWRGNCWLAPLRKRADVQIVGYVEPGESTRTRAIKDQGVPAELVFATLEEALTKVKADFVMDATPPTVHHQVAQSAFAAGLHVLGEKPLSDDMDRARQVVELGRKAGLRHMITQNFRFGSQPRATRKALAQGLIGDVGQCDVRFYMPWADIPNSAYTTQPFMLLGDMMVHHFDMMRYVLGLDPIAVQAITWNHPWGWHKGDSSHAIVIDFPGGVRGTHVCCGCSVGQQTSWNGGWHIEGQAGSIEWNGPDMWHAKMHRTPKPIHEKLPAPWRPPEDPTLLDDVLAEFLNAVGEGREPECSAQDNLKTLAMVFASIKSAREKRQVRIQEV